MVLIKLLKGQKIPVSFKLFAKQEAMKISPNLLFLHTASRKLISKFHKYKIYKKL